MKLIPTLIATAATAVLAAGAMAQTPFTTDEARAQVSKANAESAIERAFERPALDPVYPGDYRAAAHNETRIAQYVAMHRSLQAYNDGARSTPIVVTSETTARQEASRQQREQDVQRQAAYLQGSPTAQAIHQGVVRDLGLVALR